MTPVSGAIAFQVAGAGLAGMLSLLPSARARSVLAGIATAVMSAGGIITGTLAMGGASGRLRLSVAIPGLSLSFAPDRLGGLFIVVASVVGLLVAIYGAASARGAATSRTAWLALPLFLLGMQLVPAAADAVSFLLMWEAMALGSTVLLLAEHASSTRVSSATVWYAVMSQVSFLFILAGFGVLSAEAGSTAFSALGSVNPASPAALLAFVLFVLGFGSKAGLVPVHVWLPRAHPEAPSHVSAAMSAAMVKMGIYGILLVVVRLLPGGPEWWGVVLVALGAISAVYGILQASVSSDLKVLLAYSTTENVGLIVLAIGASLLLTAHGVIAAAGAALLSALLLVVSHAVFKVTLFLAAGSVLHATGERNLDHLGGLGRRMPWTTAAFGIAALGAAALPISSGFVSEWMLLQSLVHGTRAGGVPVSVTVSIAMPIAVAVVALTAGLAVLTFVKAYGIGFLARPRSLAAADAHESSRVIIAVLITGAAGVVLLGLAPGPLAMALMSVLPPSGTPIVESAGLLGVNLPGLRAVLDPIALLLLTTVLVSLVIVATLRSTRRHVQRIDAFAWGGGGERAQPRMQYTATSFAEPVVRVFDDVLQPTRDVEVTHAGESRYLVNRVRFTQTVSDLVERALYRPVLTVVDRFGVIARRIQNGSIHLYLLYSFVAVIVVLVVAAL